MIENRKYYFYQQEFWIIWKIYSFDLQRRKLVAFSRVQLILLSTWCFLLLLPRRVLSFLKFCFFNLQRRLGAFSRLFITFYQQEFWVFWKILLFQFTTKTCCFFKSSTWIKKIFCFFFFFLYTFVVFENSDSHIMTDSRNLRWRTIVIITVLHFCLNCMVKIY
jgi:hypothetical protein